MTDDSKFLEEVETGLVVRRIDSLDVDRLIAMVRERDAEIAKLKTEANRQGADYVRVYADAFRLRKMVEVARDKFTTLLNVAEIFVGVNGGGGLRAGAVQENITQTLAELDRLEKE